MDSTLTTLVDPDPAKEKPQSLPLGAGMFKEKEEKETDVYTSTMTRTRTTTVTVKPTMEAPESSAAPAASEATTAYRDSKAKIGGFNGAQSKEKVAQQPESATRVEPSVEPSASNATAIRRLPVAGTSTTPRSFPGHIAAGPPTFAPVPEGTGPQKFNNKAAPAAGETPISFPGHMVSGPLKFNNKAVFTNTSSSTGFRTVTVPGDSDA